jgi:hypothetical protein
MPPFLRGEYNGGGEWALRGGFLGSDPVLAKPVTAAELMLHIEQCLSEKRKMT